MKMIRHTMMSPHVRRLAVAVAVASAGAAVAGAVVLAERPGHIDLRATRTNEPLAGTSAMAATAHPATRSPKDAWRALPSPWAHEAAALPTDPSLPAAAAALATAPEPSDEAPPTF
jgi:hypothetical protein